MCRPDPNNFVRPRNDCVVRPLEGSSDFLLKKTRVQITKDMHGIVHDQPARDQDHRIVMFGIEADNMPGAVLMAELHCNDLKGVEL